MAIVLDQAKLEDKNYVSGIFDLLGEFVKDCGEVLSEVSFRTKCPFVPSLGIFDVTSEKNLRLHPKAFLHTEANSAYKFLCQVVSYDRDTGKLSFEVLAINYFLEAVSPFQAEERSFDGSQYVTKLSPSGAVQISSNATLAPIPLANGGTGFSETSEFLGVSNLALLENHRISTSHIFEDFLREPQRLTNWRASVGAPPQNSACGSDMEIHGSYRMHVGQNDPLLAPATLGGSTMANRAGFIELLVGGVHASSATIYIGRTGVPRDPASAGLDAGCLGTFSNSAVNSTNLLATCSYLLPVLSNATNRFRLEIGTVKIIAQDTAGIWASYVDNESSGNYVLRSKFDNFATPFSSAASLGPQADVWEQLEIYPVGSQFQCNAGLHSITRSLDSLLDFFFMIRITKLAGPAVSSVVVDHIALKRAMTLLGRRA
jgi:hypothetical protein